MDDRPEAQIAERTILKTASVLILLLMDDRPEGELWLTNSDTSKSLNPSSNG